MKKLFLIGVMICFFTQSSFAQTSTTNTNNIRRGVATVMFAGLAGAVLGLSTLSFYGEPQEHIGNIWTGLAVGVIGGSAYVLSKSAATTSSDAMNGPANPHQMKTKNSRLISYSFEF